VVDSNGTVYFSQLSRNTFDSDLVAVSRAGVVLWKVNASATFPENRFANFGSPVISADGNVLVTLNDRMVGNGASTLCSFTTAGGLMWDTPIIHNQTGIAVGGNPGSMIYAVSFYGQLQALNPNGTIAWTMDLSDRGLMVDSPGKVSRDGGLYVTVARRDNETQWLNYSSIREVWSIAPDGSVAWTYAPLVGMEGASGCTVQISALSDEGTIYLTQQGGV
jgi:hypothetical protein